MARRRSIAAIGADVTVIQQRTGRDCGIAALAILLADVAMRRVDPKMRGLDGLYTREVIQAAKVFGIILRSTRRFDLDHENGVLKIAWKDPKQRAKSPHGHFVTVISGSIYCPTEPVALPWRDYVLRYHAKPITLLREIAR